jgi:hypothetical protein
MTDIIVLQISGMSRDGFPVSISKSPVVRQWENRSHMMQNRIQCGTGAHEAFFGILPNLKTAAAADTGSPRPDAPSGCRRSPPNPQSSAPASRSACDGTPGRSCATAAHLHLCCKCRCGSMQQAPPCLVDPAVLPHLGRSHTCTRDALRRKCRCVGVGQKSAALEAPPLRPTGVPRRFHPLPPAGGRRGLPHPVVR